MWTTVLIVISLAAIAGALLWLSDRLRKPTGVGGIDPLQRRRDLDASNELKDPQFWRTPGM